MFLKAKKQKVFIRFLVPYLIILCVPLIIGLFIYNQAFIVIRKNAEESDLSKLKQTMYIMDSKINEIDKTLNDLALNKKVRNLYTLDSPYKDGKNVSEVLEVQEDFYQLGITNKLIKDIFMYFKKSNIFLSSKASYINPDFFYGYVFKFGDMEYPEWKSKILDTYHYKEYLPMTDVTINKVIYPVIPYIQSNIPGSKANINGVTIILIDGREIENLLINSFIQKGGFIYILDGKGRQIAEVTSGKLENGISAEPLDIVLKENEGSLESKLNDEDVVVSYTVSSYNSWKYISVIPSKIVMERVNSIIKIVLAIFLSSLILGILIACYLAYRNSKPIKEIITKLADTTDGRIFTGKNNYELIKTGITGLTDKYREIKEELNQQIPLLKTAFFYKLLYGGFSNNEEIEKAFSQNGIEISGNCYIVLIIQINGFLGFPTDDTSQELNLAKIIVKDEISNLTGNHIQINDIDFDMVSVFVSSNSDGENNGFVEEIENMASRLYDLMIRNYNIRISISAGNIYSRLTEISRSFAEANMAADNRNCSGKNIISWYRNISSNENSFYYPMDIEMKLISFTRAGDWDEVNYILDCCYQENIIKRNLAKDMQKYLLSEMCGTIIKLSDELKLEINKPPLDIVSKWNNMRKVDTIEETFKAITEIYKQICTKVREERHSRNVKLISSIKEYVDKEFLESQMSLTLVADKFGITEQYVSKLFKEQIGENFSNYVENLRLKYSYKLLSDTNLSVEKIAVMAGYSGANAFRKAFKRVNGINPKEFQI
jgi:Transcriptional regulator containing an amidase domain and an AraC-type DNA-binding HTH domain